MSDDWKVGDLAVCVDAKTCGFCDRNDTIPVGSVLTVSEIYPPVFPGELVGFDFAEIPVDPELIWCSCTFRKIRPDEPEACETEFVDLLNLSKKKVTA